jgi:hypothetical protein
METASRTLTNTLLRLDLHGSINSNAVFAARSIAVQTRWLVHAGRIFSGIVRQLFDQLARQKVQEELFDQFYVVNSNRNVHHCFDRDRCFGSDRAKQSSGVVPIRSLLQGN